jgi:hypothetical protein
MIDSNPSLIDLKLSLSWCLGLKLSLSWCLGLKLSLS